MGNVNMEASQINYRGGEKKMSVEDALKSTSGEAAAIAQLQTDVLNLNSNKANQITIAPFFSAEASYDPGDLVYYNGLTYRCVNAHEGDWDADDFAATTISNELDTLKSGLTNVIHRKNLPIQTATIGGDFENVISISDLENNGYLNIALSYGGYYYICRFSRGNAYQKCIVSSTITIELEISSDYVKFKLVGASSSGTIAKVTQDYV